MDQRDIYKLLARFACGITPRFLTVVAAVVLGVRSCKRDTVVIAAINEMSFDSSGLTESRLLTANAWKLDAFLFK